MKIRLLLFMLFIGSHLWGQQPYDWYTAMKQPTANFFEICDSASIYFGQYPDAEGAKAFSRWEVFWAPRVSTSDTSSSFAPYLEAVNDYLKDCGGSTICESQGAYQADWTAMGPLNIGHSGSLDDLKGVGRVIRARVDLSDTTFNTIYLGTETSGLWKTENALSGNVTWEHVTADLRMPTAVREKTSSFLPSQPPGNLIRPIPAL